MELLEKLKILNNHLLGKNYNKVIEGCNKVLKTNPDTPYALNLCGLALQGKNNFLPSVGFWYFIGCVKFYVLSYAHRVYRTVLH